MTGDAFLTQALARLPREAGLPLAGAALAWFVVGLTVVLVGILGAFGVAPGFALLFSGFNPVQLFYSVFEQVFAVTWSAGLLILFRERVNFAPGQWGAIVVGAAYTVYIIHPVALYALTRALAGLWPIHRLLQFAVETPVVILVTWLVAAAIKALPYAGLVL